MQHWSTYIWLFLAIGAPALSWAFGKMREQYEKKRMRDVQRANETEALRVQRVTSRVEQPDPDAERAKRLAELAARRQAQLEQLRQRRAQGGGAPPVATPPTSGRPPQRPVRPGVPSTPRPGVPSTGPQAASKRRPGTPTPSRPTAQQRPTMGRPTTAPPRQRVTEAPVIAQIVPPPIATKSVTASPTPLPVFHAPTAPAHETVAEEVRATLHGSPTGQRHRLATALVLADILDRPVSLRSTQPGDMVEF